MSGSLLPHALLDLTLARGSARLESLASQSLRQGTFRLARKYAHQAVALKDVPAPEYVQFDVEDNMSFYSRRQASRQRVSALASGGLFPHMPDRPLTELEKRIAELKEAPVQEITAESIPTYTDVDLTSMYEDLLAVPSRTHPQDDIVPDLEVQKQFDEATLRGIVHALYALEDANVISTDSRSQYMAAISKLREIVEALESAQSSPDTLPVEISLLSVEEWTCLVRICVGEQDGQAAETVIDLMKRSGSVVPEEVMETAMSLYVDVGDISNTERFLSAFSSPSPPERLRDLHIRAHLRALEPRTFPTTALSILHDYETRGLPAPQRSYTSLITSLLSIRSAVAEAQAWDLFSHMRYIAHPTPDAYLYTVMISACASRVIESQPARALDLFTEMTVDKRIPPTAAAYTAAIYASARTGEKLYVGEAFRLAKEMLDGNRDAYGNPAFIPDHKTFCALLEGAKRTGDLAKVRWILAEIVAISMRAGRGDVRDTIVVDEEVMTHVFHAYAAYKPPFNRAAAVLVDQSGSPSPPSPSTDPITSVDISGSEDSSTQESINAVESETTREIPQPPIAPQSSHFTTILPQSRPEIVGEVRALLSRIIRDAAPSNTVHSVAADGEGSIPHAFQHVLLTPRLLNAFLSVHYAHALFDDGAHLYHTLFDELRVQKNAWTHVEALERAGRAKRGNERKQALKFAREVWAEWQGMEEAWRRKEASAKDTNARLVERAYVAMIRVLSLTGNLREAVQLVRAFVERYSPDIVKNANPKLALRSTRTVLQAPRPLVRLFSPAEIPDDTVPPLLSFSELEILHHRLVAAGDRESIGYLKYVCMAYTGALKKRRDATLHAKPVDDIGTRSNADGIPR